MIRVCFNYWVTAIKNLRFQTARNHKYIRVWLGIIITEFIKKNAFVFAYPDSGFVQTTFL